jgi:hypothetical protein
MCAGAMVLAKYRTPTLAGYQLAPSAIVIKERGPPTVVRCGMFNGGRTTVVTFKEICKDETNRDCIAPIAVDFDTADGPLPTSQ